MPAEAPAAPAPAAAPIAAPPPPPAAPKPSGDMGSMSDSDAFSSLDSMIEPEKPAAIAPAEKPPVREDDEPAEPTPEPPKEQPKPAEDKAKQIPPKDAKDGKFVKAATLRENYDRLKGEFKALQQKQAEYEAREAERAKQPNGEATLKEIQAKYEKLQKDYEAREQEMRFVNFERSEEYKQKYEAPFIEAYQSGRSKVASLKIKEVKNDLDEVVQTARQGTEADFDAIMGTADDDAAAELAANLFGAKSPIVLYHRAEVQKANQARLKAIDDYRKQGGERDKANQAATQRQQEEQAKVYNEAIQQYKTTYKDWFVPADNDPKGNAMLEQGEALADLAYGTLKPEDIGKLPAKTQEKIKAGQFGQQDLAKLHAAIRLKAAGFDRIVARDKQKDIKIKELEAKLAEYSASEPKPGQGGGRPAPVAEDSMDSTLASMDRLVTNG